MVGEEYDELVQHGFNTRLVIRFIDLQDLLKKMLAVDPTRRLTMSQVIKHPWILRSSR